MGGEVTPERREVLLVEYQKAQDSAEHHDNQVGTVTSLWLGSAVLIGFVLAGLDSRHISFGIKVALGSVITFGIVLTLLVGTWAERASKLKADKYARCKAIEGVLEMEQHSGVDDSAGWQDWAYRILLGLLVLTWIVLLVDVARR